MKHRLRSTLHQPIPCGYVSPLLLVHYVVLQVHIKSITGSYRTPPPPRSCTVQASQTTHKFILTLSVTKVSCLKKTQRQDQIELYHLPWRPGECKGVTLGSQCCPQVFSRRKQFYFKHLFFGVLASEAARQLSWSHIQPAVSVGYLLRRPKSSDTQK